MEEATKELEIIKRQVALRQLYQFWRRNSHFLYANGLIKIDWFD
jgi:hypothetical protein